MMKKLILLAVIATSMTAMSCAGNSENNANGTDSAAAEQTAAAEVDPAAWPWDFPQSTGEQLTDGQLVLAPYTYYKVAIDDKEDLTRKGLIFSQLPDYRHSRGRYRQEGRHPAHLVAAR